MPQVPDLPAGVEGPAEAVVTPRPSERVLVNLSGGVDSVHAAWRLLAEGRKVLLHHCIIHNREGRAEVERRAVRGVVDWLNRRGLTRFELLESGYNQGNLGALPYDVELVGFLTGVILRDRRRQDIGTVVVSCNASDVSVTNPTTPRVVRRKQLAELMAGRELSWWMPFAHLTKAQMVEELPHDLLAVCWWCRRSGPQQCGACRPCREVRASNTGRPLPFAKSQEAV